MDDDQGPWWTRPPEPGPLDPARAPAEPSRTRTRAAVRRVAVVAPGSGTDRLGPGDSSALAPGRPEGGSLRGRSPEERTDARRFDGTWEAGGDRAARPGYPNGGPDDATGLTETLQAASDDIFATFSGPLPQETSRASATRGARGRDAPRTAADPAPARRLRRPDGGVLLLTAAAGLVALLIVVVALLSGRGGADPAGQPATAASARPSASGVKIAGAVPAGLRTVDGARASALLRDAGEGTGGSIVEAWEWNDANGHNLVVTSVDDRTGGKRSLRVVHLAALDTDPKRLRVMRDPDLPACRSGGTAGFTRNALVVRDLDDDNLAEITVGWSSRCRTGGDSEAKLALISDGRKFILRGQGTIGRKGSGTTAPAPKASAWPDGFYDVVTDLYRSLYF